MGNLVLRGTKRDLWRGGRPVGSVARTLLALALAALLAGCFGGASPGPGEENMGTSRPTLDQFEQCQWTFPQGDPMKCSLNLDELEMVWLRVEPSIPPGWACTSRMGPSGQQFSFYRDPTDPQGKIGLSYETNAPWSPVGGVMLETGGSQSIVYSWATASPNGFVRLPGAHPLGQSSSFDLMIYHSYYETNSTALEDGVLYQLWSARGKTLFLIQAIDVPQLNKTYYFRPISGLGNQIGYTFDIQGQDFYVFFRLLQHLRAGVGSTAGSVCV